MAEQEGTVVAVAASSRVVSVRSLAELLECKPIAAGIAGAVAIAPWEPAEPVYCLELNVLRDDEFRGNPCLVCTGSVRVKLSGPSEDDNVYETVRKLSEVSPDSYSEYWVDHAVLDLLGLDDTIEEFSCYNIKSVTRMPPDSVPPMAALSRISKAGARVIVDGFKVLVFTK